MVAMSGRDHARALGRCRRYAPARRRSRASAKAPFGKVSVVMIARPPRARRRATAGAAMSGTRAVILASGSSSPITPVEAIITWRWRQSEALGDGRGHPAGGVGAWPAGEGVGAAGVDHQGADVACPPVASSWRLHQSTGAEPTPWRVKTPAQVVPSAKLINSTSAGRACRARPGRPRARPRRSPASPGSARRSARRRGPACRSWPPAGLRRRFAEPACSRLPARRSAASFRRCAADPAPRSSVWPTISAGLAAAGSAPCS